MSDSPSGRTPAQPSLAGFAPAAPTDRLFLAVYPDAAAAERIAALAQTLRERHGLRGRPLAAERLHVTLHHLGDYVDVPGDVVRMAGAAAERVEASPFEVGFDRAESFAARSGKKPFVLLGEHGIAHLAELQRALGEALRASGLARWVAPRFTPHVTLLYDDAAIAAQPVEPVRWRVEEFVLVHSLLGRSQHTPLARWRLRG
ncbi:2'-5' RNA ligase family protein [Dokdonella sp.]|uniref:2'-5' RNA ligase family protein n=1 Tax=Dokdonella sp. TaxID=2291710 RepID=UPI001B033AF1|nr:2'-5' RNA ligase family protein [Dokdonella sp.]MBO9662566.1 2'-5' RNA ligase family protein [Dokdonella sp.]